MKPTAISFALRSLDICLSLVAIALMLPVMSVIFLFGLFDTGSPVFFQIRVGKQKRLFTLIKFRTMSLGTKSMGTHLVDNSTITKLGKFLRKTKLDELPQLFNVLFGHMSLVGPRPCLPSQKKLISEREKRRVFDVKPGVTGLAQINEVDMSTPRKLARYDMIMMHKMSLVVYIKLIIATALGKGSGDRIRG